MDWKCKLIVIMLIFLGVSSLYITTDTFISEFCVSGYLAVYYLVRFCATFYFIFQISISFAHTIGTRVRLSLLRSVSRRQKDKDPKAVCSVSSFTSRPMLRVGGGKDQGTRFLTFVDAMLGFRHLLTQEDLDKAASMCQGLKGHLKSRFLVLSDDRQPPPLPTGSDVLTMRIRLTNKGRDFRMSVHVRQVSLKPSQGSLRSLNLMLHRKVLLLHRSHKLKS